MKKGYNPIHFANYLAKERDKGDDIENWSLKSLREIVLQYREDYPEPPSSDEEDESANDVSKDNVDSDISEEEDGYRTDDV